MGVKKIRPKKVLGLLFLSILTLLCYSNNTFGPDKSVGSKPKVILDTDMDSDVDDVGALAMLLNLHKAGLIDLIGVIVTSDDPYAPVCASAINTFYGFPLIPVGFLKNQPALSNHSRYTKFIANEFTSGMNSWEDAEDAIQLYRKLLTLSPDESVVIVTIGHLSSLQALLQSLPDQISTSNGQKLVNDKVSHWICMGGKFPQGKEANFYRPDPQSTSYCVRNWEKEVIFCGQEVGNNVITGGKKLKDKLNPRHPLYRAYELYNGFAGRQSWDQIAIMQLISQSRNFFSYVDGHCLVASDGSNGWENDISGNHHYVILKPHTENSHISNYIDSLMIGTVLPPQRNLSNRQPNDPVRLILDTDMLTDCDDAAAMAILHKLADLGEVDILATMVSSRYPMSAPVVDVINTFFGRPDIPIGAPKNGTGAYKSSSVFLDTVASGFRHLLKSNDDAPDAVELYRDILSTQTDSSVVLLTIGYMSNIESLLKSNPDSFSKLSGYELVKTKVKVWICMGGNFPVDNGSSNVNFTRDPQAAVYAINNWPGKIIFAGREIGHNIFIGEKLRNTPLTNPVRRAYELHRGRANTGNWNHHTADPCAVMLAVRGLADYWDLEKDGFIDLKEDCSFVWRNKPGARQGYLLQKMDRTKLANIMEELLISPPESSF